MMLLHVTKYITHVSSKLKILFMDCLKIKRQMKSNSSNIFFSLKFYLCDKIHLCFLLTQKSNPVSKSGL